MSETTYPDCYLHVTECASGMTWIKELGPEALLDLKGQLRVWVQEQFCGELELDDDLIPGIEGEYYGKIMTDGRPPESVICWEAAGFYLNQVDP